MYITNMEPSRKLLVLQDYQAYSTHPRTGKVMTNRGYWERDDGEPWESVESLPIPPRTVSPPTQEPFPWESLESLPMPSDAEPKPSSAASKTDAAPKTKEAWSFWNLEKGEDEEDKEDEDHEEEPKLEGIGTPLSPTTPRVPTRPAVDDDIESIGDIDYIPLDYLPEPARRSGRDPYPPYPAPPPWPYPGPLYPGPLDGARRQSPVHGRNNHPLIVQLSRLVAQSGIAPVQDFRRSRRGRQRPLSPLPPLPIPPEQSGFDIEDVSYEVCEEKPYDGDREVQFPRVPPYLPPTIKKARSPLRRKWNCEEIHTHTHTLSRILGSYSHPAASAIDPFWEYQSRLWPIDKYQNLAHTHPNYPTRMLLAPNIGRLMNGWEDQGLVKISEAWKRERKKEERRIDRYTYHSGRGEWKGKKPSVGYKDHVEEEDGVDEDKEPYYDDRDAPEWTDEDEPHRNHRGRERLRCDSVDRQDIDDHNFVHYPPPPSQAFDVKRIRDNVIKPIDGPERKGNSKVLAPALNTEGEDTEGIYYESDAKASSKLKKLNPYEAFKRTTGRQPRHFNKSRKNTDEVFERFVLDRRPLVEGKEEPTRKHSRRPMIDTVNLKTGKRTGRKIRGYNRLPRMIRVAAGVEGLGGLPPRWKREAEEVDEGGDEVKGMQSARGKISAGRRKKKDSCVVM